MLKVSDLNTFYGDSHVLHNVSLTVEQGKVTVLLGRNGMGKQQRFILSWESFNQKRKNCA